MAMNPKTLLLATLLLGFGLVALDSARKGSPGTEVSRRAAKNSPRLAATTELVGRPTLPAHPCNGACAHDARPVVARPLSDPEAIQSLLAAEPGREVRLTAGDRTWTIEVQDRREQADGHLVIRGKTVDGGFLHLVTDGRSWEGGLIYPDRTEAWVLRGDGREGTIESRPLSAVLCSTEVGGLPVGGLPPYSSAEPGPEGPGEWQGPPIAESAPILNSLPGANGVIYLDFDGETVSGKAFNTYFTGGAPIVAGAAGFSNAQIQTVWATVAEDFRPFSVNVTTDLAVFNAAASNRRVQVIFTPDNEWYGASGGVAFVGTFGSSSYDEPAWVFVDQLLNNNAPYAPYAAEAASHEAGHTLGLIHDGNSGGDYYYGHGSGLTSWAPIMGASYGKSVTQWSKGEYPTATNGEDDLVIISSATNGLGYRADDFADTTGAAGPMPTITNGGTTVEAAGVIERTTDVDLFELQVYAGSVSFTAVNDPTAANLDIKLRLLNSAGGEVASFDPAGTLDAILNASVSTGTYYLEISGVGVGSTSTGYTDYGSLGAYLINGTLPAEPVEAEILSPSAASISLPAGTGLVLEGALTAGTPQWYVIATPAGGSAQFSAAGSQRTDCVFTGAGIYQLRYEVTHQAVSDTADLLVSVEGAGEAKVFANRGTGVDLGTDGPVYDTTVLLGPLLLDDGTPGGASTTSWSVLSGDATFSNYLALQPLLTMGSSGSCTLRLEVDDGEISTYGEVTLSGQFHQEVLLAAGSEGRVHIPLDGSIDAQWKSVGFNDLSWQGGALGAGFNTNPSAPDSSLYQGLIGAGLDVEPAMSGIASSCYLRVPFALPDASAVLQMALRMHYDDGFVAYINGAEVARSNAPGGTPAWNSTAASDRSDIAAETAVSFDLSIPPGLLVDGINVLAIHGLNSTSAGSDREFVLLPELEVWVASLPFLQSVALIPDASQRGFLDDPDGDGQTNLEEHAAGTNPNLAEFPVAIDVRAGAQELNVDVRVRLPVSPPADVRYDLEYRNYLTDAWGVVATRESGGPWNGVPPSETGPDGPNHLVFVFDHTEIEQSFWRLKISRIQVPGAPLVSN